MKDAKKQEMIDVYKANALLFDLDYINKEEHARIIEKIARTCVGMFVIDLARNKETDSDVLYKEEKDG